MKKENRGGKRARSGRLPKYNEPTKIVTFRVPTSHIDNIKELIRDYLQEIEQKKLLINILDVDLSINILDTEKPQP